MVVVPRLAELQRAEDELAEHALVATIAGTRPWVSTLMLYQLLYNSFEIRRDEVDVRLHEPEDFLVRFQRREHRDRVLASHNWSSPVPLRWRPWTRLAGGVGGAFTHRVVVALRHVPAHARDVATAQAILGRCCAEVQLSNLRDRTTEDDREFFVQAWCWHPSFIEPEKIVFIPEPGGTAEPDLRRGMQHLVKLRLVAHRQLGAPSTPPPNDDDDESDQGDDNDDDQGDDNDDDLPANDGGDFDYCPTPRRDSDGDSLDSDPRNGRYIPYCDYPSEFAADVTRKIIVGGIACPVQPGGRQWSSPSSSAATLEVSFGRAPSSARHSYRRPLCFDSPSQEVFREAPSPGLVARFINAAPHRLQAGNDVTTPPQSKAGDDWWAEGVSMELWPRPRPSSAAWVLGSGGPNDEGSQGPVPVPLQLTVENVDRPNV